MKLACNMHSTVYDSDCTYLWCTDRYSSQGPLPVQS
jgi:hypothetical protein